MIFQLFFDLLKQLKWLIPVIILLAFAGAIIIGYMKVQELLNTKVELPPVEEIMRRLAQGESAISIVTVHSVTPTPTATVTPWPDVVTTTATTGTGTYTFTTEVANTNAKRTIGYMYRSSIVDAQAMLFIFDFDSQSPFWMKNVEFPLDIVFVDKDNKIVEVMNSVPPCKSVDPTQGNCPYYVPKQQYRYALEMKGGIAARYGISTQSAITWK